MFPVIHLFGIASPPLKSFSRAPFSHFKILRCFHAGWSLGITFGVRNCDFFREPAADRSSNDRVRKPHHGLGSDSTLVPCPQPESHQDVSFSRSLCRVYKKNPLPGNLADLGCFPIIGRGQSRPWSSLDLCVDRAASLRAEVARPRDQVPSFPETFPCRGVSRVFLASG